jgi:hypothetical protein
VCCGLLCVSRGAFAGSSESQLQHAAIVCTKHDCTQRNTTDPYAEAHCEAGVLDRTRPNAPHFTHDTAEGVASNHSAVVQMEAMVKELQERGDGAEALADAHAAWQAAQDDAALTTLRRCIKHGFAKGRKRLGVVRARLAGPTLAHMPLALPAALLQCSAAPLPCNL